MIFQVMPRLARIVVPGLSHHITQRGNNKQDVFFVDDDKWRYLRILKEQSIEYGRESIRKSMLIFKPATVVDGR